MSYTGPEEEANKAGEDGRNRDTDLDGTIKLAPTHINLVKQVRFNGQMLSAALCLLLVASSICQAQQSLEHWQVDLDYRIASYRQEHNLLKRLVQSTIQETHLIAPRIVFKELKITDGGRFILDSSYWKMVNSTQVYLNQIRHQVFELNHQKDEVKRKIVDKKFIYKNRANFISGIKNFHAPTWISSMQSPSVALANINHLDVNPTIKRVFFDSSFDRQNRLYFEGTKIFERSTFEKSLRSGCCNRLVPLSVKKMMTTFANQTLETPGILSRAPLRVSNLKTELVHNEQFRLTESNLVPINRSPSNVTVGQNLIFTSGFKVNKLSSTNAAIEVATSPSRWFKIASNQYLMQDGQLQRISHPVVMIGPTRYSNDLDSFQANGVENFQSFVERSIVRLDRPSNILSPVTMIEPSTSLLINGQLNVDKLNGLSTQDDLLTQQMLTSNAPITVGVRKYFQQWPHFNSINTQGRVGSIILPNEILTVVGDDPVMITDAQSSLLFSEGITTKALTLSSDKRNFDRLDMDQSVDSAASLVTKASFENSLNGMRLLKSQLTVNELLLTGNEGLLNGMRIEDLLMSNQSAKSPMPARISFVGHVEVSDCSFSSINHVANWMGNMIHLHSSPQYVNTRLILEKDPYRISNGFSVQQLIINDPILASNQSPEFMALHRTLSEHYKLNSRPVDGHKINSYRIGNQLILINQLKSKINNIPLSDILTRNSNGPISGKVTFVGRIDVGRDLLSNFVNSKEPFGGIDIVQFDMFRIHLQNPQQYPMNFNNILLDNSQFSCDLETKSINSVHLQEFIRKIFSVSRNQIVSGPKAFGEVVFRHSVQPYLVNGVRFAEIKQNAVKIAGHGRWESHFNDMVFQDGLTVISVIISNQSTIIANGKATSYPELKSMQVKMKHNLIDRIIIRGNLVTNSLTIHSSN